MIDNLLKGYNSTLLAYGATGTGKTHTIFGNIHSITDDYSYIEKGISMYAIDHLFKYLANDANKVYNIKVVLY